MLGGLNEVINKEVDAAAFRQSIDREAGAESGEPNNQQEGWLLSIS